MADTSALPNGTQAPDDRFPDCIIASSWRYNDVKPFCMAHYHENPKKWGCILPWNFPPNADRETEEAFLRSWFTELEIHMQGGAHGPGKGFEFLKQAWYSIAMWNEEHMLPNIAKWWLHQPENASLIEDPATRGPFFSDEAVPETFFSPREIEDYGGRNIITWAVKEIQKMAKIRLDQQAEAAKSAEAQESSSSEAAIENGKLDGGSPPAVVPPGLQEAAVQEADVQEADVQEADVQEADVQEADVQEAAVQEADVQEADVQEADVQEADVQEAPIQEEQPIQPSTNTRVQAQIPPVSAATDNTPFPNYRERGQSNQSTTSGERKDSSSGYAFPTQQVQSRKRGSGGHASTGSTRMSNYDRRQQEYQYNYSPNMYPSPGAFDPSFQYFNAAASNQYRTMQAGQGNQAYPPYAAPTPRQQPLEPYAPVNQNFENSFPARHHSGSHPQQLQMPYNLRPGESDRNVSDRSGSFGFNNVSNKSGDARRSSVGSRGGSVRGQFHEGRGRGGKSRESFHETAPVPFFEQRSYQEHPTNDFNSKSTTGQGKRRGGAYQDNSWRSYSERSSLPQRAFSGPDQFATFPEFQGPTASQLLPPFSFPRVDQQTAIQQHPLPALDTSLQPEPLDDKVGESYIGADATHANQLIVFDIPLTETSDDAAKRFAHDCTVEVTNVHLRPPNIPDAQSQMAFITFPSHTVARQVLDLRGVQLYGRPLHVRVPKRLFEQSASEYVGQNPAMRPNRGQQSQPGIFQPGGMFVPRSNEYPHGFPQQPQSHPTPRTLQDSGFDPVVEGSRRGYTTYPPVTPFRATKGDSALSTVPSVNTTPETSGANTPKKSKKKGKGKSKTSTPLANDSQGDVPGKNTAASKVASRETRTPGGRREKQEFQDRLDPASDTISALTESCAPGQPQVQNQHQKHKQSEGQKQTRNEKQTRSTEVPTSDSKIKAIGESLQTPRREEGRTATAPNKPAQTQMSPDELNDHPDSTSQVAEYPRPSSVKDVPTRKEPEPVFPSSERPDLVDRASDSDHVDDSFHTANASPPVDKQPQGKNAKQSSNKKSTSTKSKNAEVKPTDSHVSPSPAVSAQQATSTRGQADSRPKENQTPRSASQRKVTGSSDAAKSITGPAKSVNPPERAANPPAAPQDSQIGNRGAREASMSVKELEDKSPMSKAKADLTIQTTMTGNSNPPASTTVYQTAPTTPASKQAPQSSGSAEKAASQSKASVKKGPSQTESFSMFGKKPQKQKKPAKGKGSLKGKPLDSGKAPSLVGDSTKSDASGTATSASPMGMSSSGKKPDLKITTKNGNNAAAKATSKSGAGSKNKEPNADEEITSVVSGQGSPSKGGPLDMILGMFGRKQSTSVSGKETMPGDTTPDNELMDSKPPADVAQPPSDLDDDLQKQSASALDNFRASGDPSLSTELGVYINTSKKVDNRSETPFGGPETPKKKRKSKSKGKKRADKEAGSSDGDGEGEEAGSASQLPVVVASRIYEVESDTRSNGSSSTAGQPTPPVSPANLSPSNKKRIELRTSETDHIITPRAPRNQHVKKKSYSRNASSATASGSVQDNEKEKEKAKQIEPLPSTAATQTEIDQQDRVLLAYRIPSNTVAIPLAFDDGPREKLVLVNESDVNITFLRPATNQLSDERYLNAVRYNDLDESSRSRVIVAAEELEVTEGADSEVAQQANPADKSKL